MTDKDYRSMLEEIDSEGEGLTDWEVGFVSDLIDNPPEVFTFDQRKKIIQIHDRRVPT